MITERDLYMDQLEREAGERDAALAAAEHNDPIEQELQHHAAALRAEYDRPEYHDEYKEDYDDGDDEDYDFYDDYDY